MGIKKFLYATGKLLSIRTYLVSMNLALLLLFTAISLLFWYQFSDFYRSEQIEDVVAIRSAMEERSASLVRSMALSANQAITGYDFSFLVALMQQVADGDKDIRYCMVVSKLGQVVAHNEVQTVGTKLDQKMIQMNQKQLERDFANDLVSDFSVRIIKPSQGGQQDQTMHVVTPVFNGQALWGTLRCGIALASLQANIERRIKQWDQEMAQVRLFYISVAALFLGIGFMSALIITRRLLKAVKQLDTGVKEVSSGDLDYRLDMKGLFCSEFGSFAASFNRMTTNLELSRKALDEYNRSLEQKVEERTVELARSNKELEAFNYSVSHDLRASLRSIDGFSQVLSEEYQDKIDEQGRDYLQRVRAASTRMGELIDDMLRLSRLGRQEMQVATVDLSELVTELLNKLLDSEPERKISFQVEPSLKVKGDRHLLAIALDNLLGNAWKYTAYCEHTNIVFGKTEMNTKACYFVKDNGAGFEMRYADRLFAPFQRLHKSTEFEGSGIGLATVARIIHRHGGSVWAESEVGKGAIFYFELGG
jgi:signal transduction histidine kinase